MAKSTMDSKEITQALTSLLTSLAGAIGWVSQQTKALSLELPDEISPGPTGMPKPGGCLAPGTEAGRTHAEILIAVLKLMKETGNRRPASKGPK